jgi:hypothetical protein
MSSPHRTGNFSGQKEEDFELMIDAFKKRLEDSNGAGGSMPTMKLRPNCDTAWIERLKG